MSALARKTKRHLKVFVAMACVFCLVAPMIAGVYYIFLHSLYVLSGKSGVTLDQLLYFPTLSALFFVLLPGLLLAPLVLGVLPAFLTCLLSFAVYLLRGFVRWWQIGAFALLACSLPLGFEGGETQSNLIEEPVFVLSGFLAALTICWWRGAFGFKEIIR